MSAPNRPAGLAPEARIDYTEILLYTLRTRGDRQMNEYSDQLEQAFVTIGGNPSIGRRRDDLRPGLRSFPVGQHIVFYRVDGSDVTVVRILHAKQDVERQFR
jgi:toxin ParE1/3/4